MIDPEQLPPDYDKVKEMFKARDKGICPFCGVSPTASDFRDPLSFKEWQISGLCMRCQDKFFK